MSTITQTIPSYKLGISEQPDEQKLPGQVRDAVNVVPDMTAGMVKRPGTKFISSLSNVQTDGCWFNYYRDENEGSYVGQVARDGTVRVWRCNDGTEMTLSLSNAPGTYLAHSADGDIQTVTINDTTFLVNRTVTAAMKADVTASKPDAHSAFIEVKQLAPRRTYALNFWSNETYASEKTATTVKLTLGLTNNQHGDESCPYTGSKVHVDSSTGIAVRVTVTGAPYVSGYNNNPDTARYDCSYTGRVDLLHGGSYVNALPSFTVNVEGINHTVVVTEEVTSNYRGNLARVRPVPVDLEAETSNSVSGVLSAITEQIPSPLTATIIGNGIYVTSTSTFNVEALESDLFTIITDQVNDVTSLPKQCKHGYIVKVTNSSQLTEDDYFLKFVGDNDTNGPGYWEECPEPGIQYKFDETTLPYILTRTGATTMDLEAYTWAEREVGDDNTNPQPSFIGKKISKVLFHRDRLAFLSGPNLILSQPGALNNFWNKTALTFSGIDRIDISCSSSTPNELVNGIEMNTGLVLFSSTSQYLFTTDSDVLNPQTAKIYTLSTFNYNTSIAPISLGTSLAFVDNAGKFSRFFEMYNIRREGEPDVVEQSKTVSRLLGNDLDLIANSRENTYVFLAKSGSQDVIGYRYFNVGEKRIQQAWFKWRFRRKIKYHFIIDDDYYMIYDDQTFTRMPLNPEASTPSIKQGTDEYVIHLDHYQEVPTSSMTYDAATNKTSFTLPDAFNSSGSIAAIVTENSIELGRYQVVESLEQSFEHLVGEYQSIDVNVDTYAELIDVVSADTAGSNIHDIQEGVMTNNIINAGAPNVYDSGGQTVKLTGDWTDFPIQLGYLYEMSVELPTVYPTSVKGSQVVADTAGSLIVHRLHFNFGQIGEFWTVLKRTGKPDYLDKHESSVMNGYYANRAPFVGESFRTVPVFERNTAVNVILKSMHPSPAVLESLTWEGDYSTKFYRRV